MSVDAVGGADGLAWFNQADPDRLRAVLLALTASPVWAAELVAGRPFATRDDVLDRSDDLIVGLPETEVDAALAGHPRIGERAIHLDAAAAARLAAEQAGMASADADQARAQDDANAAYEATFGRIYLVAAAGRSAAELLATARARLGNDPTTELEVVRNELAKITRSRLSGLLSS